MTPATSNSTSPPTATATIGTRLPAAWRAAGSSVAVASAKENCAGDLGRPAAAVGIGFVLGFAGGTTGT